MSGAATPQQIVGTLEGEGYSRAGAAAITGNLTQESSLNPNVGQHGTSQTASNLGTGAGGYGLAQWTDPIRQLGLVHYASTHNAPVNSVGTQLGYLNAELSSSHPALAAALKHGGNVNGLTTAFEQQYEGAGTPNMGNRLSAAQKAFNTSGSGTTYSLPGTTLKNQAPTTNTTPDEAPSNLGTQLGRAFSHPGAGAGDFASQLDTALNARPKTPVVAPGTTQEIPDQHIASVAQLGDDPHNLALAGALAISHDPRLESFNHLMTSADNINKSGYNYEWGGGHNASFQPTTGSGHGSGAGVGYDCSGAISHILDMAGLLKTPLVAGQFAHLNQYVASAQPGVGSGPHTITIYANADHTFAKIGDTYFGTSSENRGGGAGWIGATTENNNADFTAWHINF